MPTSSKTAENATQVIEWLNEALKLCTPDKPSKAYRTFLTQLIKYYWEPLSKGKNIDEAFLKSIPSQQELDSKLLPKTASYASELNRLLVSSVKSLNQFSQGSELKIGTIESAHKSIVKARMGDTEVVRGGGTETEVEFAQASGSVVSSKQMFHEGKEQKQEGLTFEELQGPIEWARSLTGEERKHLETIISAKAADYVQYTLEETGWSQNELPGHVRIKRSTLRDIHGRKSSPSEDNAHRLRDFAIFRKNLGELG